MSFGMIFQSILVGVTFHECQGRTKIVFHKMPDEFSSSTVTITVIQIGTMRTCSMAFQKLPICAMYYEGQGHRDG